jgi:hypothetical protein
LQALETVLHYFSIGAKANEVQFPKVGDPDAPESALTNFTFLGALIEQGEEALKVDRKVVDIRDAIAHGRLLGSEQRLSYCLWKFGYPKGERAPVEFCQELTVEWLTATRNMIDQKKQKVVDCFKARGYEGLR